MPMSEEGRRAVAEANRKRVWTEEQRRAIGVGGSGPRAWFVSLSPDERAAYSKKLSEAQILRHRQHPEEGVSVGQKVAAAWTPERREQMSLVATRENYRRVEAGEHPFQSEENKALTGSLGIKQLASRGKTMDEIWLEVILDDVAPGEFRFNDGWFELAGKAPDFVNIKGKKILIEMFGHYYHSWEESVTRCALFARHGYRTLIVWDYEYGLPGLSQRVRRFIYPNKVCMLFWEILRAFRRCRSWRS